MLDSKNKSDHPSSPPAAMAQSSQIAHSRIQAMKSIDLFTAKHEHDTTHNKTMVQLPNPTPPDNNKFWETNHNPLSSKGD